MKNLPSFKEWIPVPCWHDCGGRCLLKAQVENGKVIRLGTDERTDFLDRAEAQRACQRGFAQRQQIFAPDRLKYPMKRKHWSIEDPRGHLRGRDEWERISWEEAFRLSAEAIRKIYEAYGPMAALVLGGQEVPDVLKMMGGYLPRWGQVSWGAWPAVYELMTGHGQFAFAWDSPDRFTLKEQKLVILWGADPAVSSAGLPIRHYAEARQAGCRFVVIDPRYTDTIRQTEATWIPIRPGTDTAMILGMMYHIVEQNLHDQEYLNRYCVGFDADHMPPASEEEFCYRPLERPDFHYRLQEIDRGDNLLDYLFARGKYAGTCPKSPGWASQICGVPEPVIKALAEEYACTKPASIFSGGAPARINQGEAFPHALVTLGLLCGQIGRGGASVCACMHERAANGGPKLCFAGKSPVSSKIPENPYSQKTYGINNGEIWSAVLTGRYTAGKGKEHHADIHFLYQGKGGALNQRVGMADGIRAYQKVDFALCVNYVMNPSARYSDIILPCTTQWERPGIIQSGNREILLYGQQAVKPLYEARSDQEIARGLAAALEFREEDLYPEDEWQQLFRQLQGCRYLDPEGQYQTLLTITREDIERYSQKAGHPLQGTVQEGLISLEEFERTGIFQIPEPERYRYRPFEDFIRDPKGAPLKTASGKFEIYCHGLSAYIESLGFGHKSPLPVYEPVLEGYEEGRSTGWNYQLITFHGPGGANHTFANVPSLSQAFPRKIWISQEDAEKEGIRSGDKVLVESRYGKSVCPVYISRQILPGVLALAQGAWADVDEQGIDQAGSANILSGPVPTGQGHSGYNSILCRIRKDT